MRLGLYKRQYRIFPRKHRNNITVCFIAILFLLFIISTAIFFVRVRPVFLIRADSYINNVATRAINDSLDKVFSNEAIAYKDLISVNTDEEGNVVSLETNIAKVNYLKSRLANTVQSTVSGTDYGKIEIPLGSILSNEVFQGMGPAIGFRVSPTATASVDFADEFASSGINQVKHQIYLDIDVNISLVSSAMDKNKTVSSRVLVAETVIVGNTPEYYSEDAPIDAIVE